ncbi:MAG: uracil-DNA glycosylase [Candidatus Tectimicrobiota bacterium]
MSRPDLAASVAAVHTYVRYLQQLGVTELPITIPPLVQTAARASGASLKAAAPPKEAATVSPQPPPVPTETSPSPAVRLAQLAAEVRHCSQCRLHTGRTQVVFGTGDPLARLVFVGEAPGREEDRQGEPFVGPAGQLLNRIIAAIGLTREQVYILNVVKCRPPNNRNPEADEIAACWPILERQLACLQPEIICALGTFAAQTLLRTDEKISRLRGRLHPFGALQLMPTYHPAFLLRNPQYKRAVWEDMQIIQRTLGLV